MPSEREDILRCDVLIVGASAGGVAAALAASSSGANVILTEETDWVGGQLTSQGVCTPDEHRHIETFGGTRSYYRFRNAVRDWYRSNYNLAPNAAEDPFLNPGSSWVSRLSYEPSVGAAILREMLAPYERSGNLRILYRTRPFGCEMDGLRIRAVALRGADRETVRVEPQIVLDATDLGDLLPLCGDENEDWVTGAESIDDTGEPDAQPIARPDWVQPFTFPFAVEWSPATAATNVIPTPHGYDEWKLSQNYAKMLHGAITGIFSGSAPWWEYRRILAASNFDDPRVPNDVAMINTAGNDFQGGNVIGANAGDAARRAATLWRARNASRGYLRWLQTECPREDNVSGARLGYPEMRLRGDLFGTSDGCSVTPYIRESRRIRSHRPILEQEIVVNDFNGNVCLGTRSRAVRMPDSVGIGHYYLDIHPNGHGEPNHFVATRPFQIPLGALVPRRIENLIPACKNIATTHLTNGAYRLHPIEWNIGESAGHLATRCVELGVTPSDVASRRSTLLPFQVRLLEAGVPLVWYTDVPLGHTAFAAVHRVAIKENIAWRDDSDLLFLPDESIALDDWARWRIALELPAHEPPGVNRGEAARLVAAEAFRNG